MNTMTTRDSTKLYIVVADDEIEDHKLIKAAIKKCDVNYIVTSVYNGMQLMDLLLKRDFYKTDSFRAPDLIILDLKMHLLDGIEALRQINEHAHLKEIPVYVLTVSRNEEDKSKAMENGATAVYSKPLNRGSLDDLLHSICEAELSRKAGRLSGR
jgi:CheY-like chemotaxis protein